MCSVVRRRCRECWLNGDCRCGLVVSDVAIDASAVCDGGGAPSNDGWAMSEGVMRVLWPFDVVFWDFAC